MAFHACFRDLSALPSVLLWESFIGTGVLVFTETQHTVRGLCGVCVCDKAEFFEEKYFAPEMGKMDQKWTKSRGFLIYCKIL